METSVVQRSSDVGFAPNSPNESDLGSERADPFCLYSCHEGQRNLLSWQVQQQPWQGESQGLRWASLRAWNRDQVRPASAGGRLLERRGGPEGAVVTEHQEQSPESWVWPGPAGAESPLLKMDVGVLAPWPPGTRGRGKRRGNRRRWGCMNPLVPAWIRVSWASSLLPLSLVSQWLDLPCLCDKSKVIPSPAQRGASTKHTCFLLPRSPPVWKSMVQRGCVLRAWLRWRRALPAASGCPGRRKLWAPFLPLGPALRTAQPQGGGHLLTSRTFRRGLQPPPEPLSAEHRELDSWWMEDRGGRGAKRHSVSRWLEERS